MTAERHALRRTQRRYPITPSSEGDSSVIDPRKPLCLVLVAVLAAVTRAQDAVLFPQRSLRGIVDFDVDGDGLKDAIDSNAGGVSVAHGHGNGTFDPKVTVVQETLSSMIAGDVTGDGVADLIVLAGASPVTTINVYPGTGTAFGAAVETPVPHDLKTSDQVLADMNGDGFADWIANERLGGLYGPAEIHVALSGGDGTFHFPAPTSVPEGARGFAVGDVDGDGALDVATLAENAPVAVHLGHGDGTLAPAPVNSALPPSVTSALSTLSSRLAARDLDGDGLCDLLASIELQLAAGVPSGGVAVILHADGGGQLSPGASYATTHAGPIIFGDCNGDALGDAVIFTYPGLATLLADGVGGLRAPIASPVSSSGFSTTTSTKYSLVDLDGDGHLDAIPQGSFVPGRGDGSFDGGTHLSVGGSGPRTVATADVTGDGLLDLVVPQSKKGKNLMVLAGDGEAGFTLHDTGSPTALDVALGDLDGDGDVDIVATDHITTAQTAVRENLGDGLTWSPTVPFLNFAAVSPQLADLDGDGALDVLAAKTAQKDLLLIPGDGQGGFLPAQTITTDVGLAQVALADLDSDGTPDIVTRWIAEGKLELMPGLGGGAFGPPQDVPVPMLPTSFAIADLDRDGLQDLAVAFPSPYGHSVRILYAQAPGVFGPWVSIAEAYHVSNLRVADIDRDGWPDLVVVLSFSELEIYRNMGDESFEKVHSSEINDYESNLLLDDVNGDGFQDVIVWDTDTDNIAVLPNLAAGYPSLGYQHATSMGLPHLLTTGEPEPNTLVSFTATKVPTPASGALILGLDFTPQAFSGGTLVPSPDVLVPMRPDVALVGRWPSLPQGTKVFAQAWFSVAGNIAATNAVMAISQ